MNAVDGQSGKVTISDNGVSLDVPTGSGGGGSSPTSSAGIELMTLVSYHMDATNGDYIICTKQDGSANVAVYLDPQLQSSISSQTMPDTVHWYYNTYTEANQSRISQTPASFPTTIITEYITPPFLAGNKIVVFTLTTPITVGSSTFNYICSTGRQWAS